MRYLTSLGAVPRLSAEERTRLEAVTTRFAFRATDYYLGLIDWSDPADPIRRIILPRGDELADGGALDASNEAAVTVSRGVQHKYPDTVLLLCNEVCAGYCRYCFRKRLFMNNSSEASRDVGEGLRYIAAHPEVSNVLLTGGDPLLMSTRRLREILSALRLLPHVHFIRLGSKLPAFNPWRVLDDAELLEVLGEHSTPRNRIYLMAHFDHPRELTDPAVEALDRLLRSGVILTNQCPLVRGVNDDPAVLAELFHSLAAAGCPPYYVFQGRPTAGNAPYQVPIVRGWEIVREALRLGSGLARRARFVMSHASGKIEILAVDERSIYLRYHRARDPSLRGRFLIYRRDDQACWLDELEPQVEGDAPRFAHEPPCDVVDGPD